MVWRFMQAGCLLRIFCRVVLHGCEPVPMRIIETKQTTNLHWHNWCIGFISDVDIVCDGDVPFLGVPIILIHY